MRVEPTQRIGLVMSPRLGDSLLTMIIVNNLVRSGFSVEIFSNQIFALREWFPGFIIHPAPIPADAPAQLGDFDVLLHAYPTDVIANARAWHANVLIMDEWPLYRQVKNMVEIQLDLCRHEFGLPEPIPNNGLVAPAGLIARGYVRRVMLHPTASDAHKSWLPLRFLKLAQHLQTSGFEPHFLLAPSELPDWQWVASQGFTLRAFSTLSDVAAYLYESGWLIGNDSGIGHLASNLGVPVVTLAMRRKIAARWRPGWGPSRAVLPLPWMPGRVLKERFWKYLLPTSRVIAAFDDLRAHCDVAR